MQRATILISINLLSCSSDYELMGEKPNVDPGSVTDCLFSPVPGTKVSVYDCNPVFPGEEEGDVGSIGFYATEVLGHPFYQMWYGSDLGMEYAVSSNGTDWDTYPESPLFGMDSGAWDQDAVTGQVVVRDTIDDQYLMSYQGYNLGNPSDSLDDTWGIGVATSPDGIDWTKHPDNPVIDFTEYEITETDFWNHFCNVEASDSYICDLLGVSYTSATEPSSAIQPCWPLTITLTDRGTFRGYIGAKDSMEMLNSFDWAQFEADIWAGNEASLQSNGYAACDIYSMDGLSPGSWMINEGQPAIAGTDGGPDAGGAVSAAVVEYGDVQYMFYIGFEEWEEDSVYEGVISAVRTTLNLATSEDGGVSWTKDLNNPIPIHLTDPGQLSAIGAQVIGSRIHLWVTDSYSGQNAVGYFYYEPELESDH
jgi:hypothetical protein